MLLIRELRGFAIVSMYVDERVCYPAYSVDLRVLVQVLATIVSLANHDEDGIDCGLLLSSYRYQWVDAAAGLLPLSWEVRLARSRANHRAHVGVSVFGCR